MMLNNPDGGSICYPRKRIIPRSALQAAGTWQEVHCNGHEKLGTQALQLGGVSLPIYGFKDQFSSELMYLVVLPNDCLVIAVAHVYLDFVAAYLAGLFPSNVSF
jgi:hypothetical protein